MSRSKIRNANAALSRGQMVRTDNSFNLNYRELPFDPDVIGSCCSTGGSAGPDKCFCESGISQLVLVVRKTARLSPVLPVKMMEDMYGVAQVPHREHVVTHAQILPVSLVTVEKPLRKNCRQSGQLFTANVTCAADCGDLPNTWSML